MNGRSAKKASQYIVRKTHTACLWQSGSCSEFWSFLKKAENCGKTNVITDGKKHRQLPELAGKQVLIVGTGYVGRAAAKRISAFEANVVGVNRSGHSVPDFREVYSAEQLDELLPSTDILILALPLTADTFGLIDGRRLALMPCTSVIINVSRGSILDEAALTDALKGKRLFGAALDVFTQEPLPADSPLWDMERVLISSHNSFSGAGNHQRLWHVIRKNLIERSGEG